MRCHYCGKTLEKETATCPRCGSEGCCEVDWRDIALTIVFALISIAIVAILVFAVLAWHESQIALMDLA